MCMAFEKNYKIFAASDGYPPFLCKKIMNIIVNTLEMFNFETSGVRGRERFVVKKAEAEEITCVN
jgi:hypothetical protein